MWGGIAESRRFAERGGVRPPSRKLRRPRRSRPTGNWPNSNGGVRRPRPTTPRRTVSGAAYENRPDCMDPAETGATALEVESGAAGNLRM